MEIPTGVDDITPKWMTQILAASCVIKHTSITSVEYERLGDNHGWIGKLFRFRPTYHMYEESAPVSIVAKISSGAPELRKKISDEGFYKREVNFYKEIADKIDIRTPHCYYGSLDEETGDSVLLLEDLQNGHFGDLIRGCSANEAEIIVEYLVPLHASWWGNPELESMDWIYAQPLLDEPDVKEEWQQGMHSSWCQFSEKYGDRIPSPIEEAWSLLSQHGDKIRRQSLLPPLTLCHGDYHLENLFFDTSGEDRSVVAFDWEFLYRAQGALDLSYFLIWNLEPELRRKVEERLLKNYCAELKKQGVEDYSIGQCYHGYRLTLYEMILPRLVGVAANLDLCSDPAQLLISTLLARTSEAIIDHPIAELI